MPQRDAIVKVLNAPSADGQRGCGTMETFYDTHAHLTYPDFAAELPQVLERAAAVGIQRVIVIGTDLQTSQQAIALSQSHASVYAVVGWHPNDLAQAPQDVSEALRPLCAHPKVVALGETGLDHHRLPSSRGGSPAEDEVWKERQARVFRQHLELAVETGLNCVIHQRTAMQPTLDIFAEYHGRVRGQFHCFVDDPAAMQRVLALDSLVSFTGVATFKSAEVVRQTIAAVPMGRFMLETDCPFLAPTPHRGQRCEPAYVRLIAETVAQIKQCTLQELSEATCAAAHGFFRKLA